MKLTNQLRKFVHMFELARICCVANRLSFALRPSYTMDSNNNKIKIL